MAAECRRSPVGSNQSRKSKTMCRRCGHCFVENQVRSQWQLLRVEDAYRHNVDLYARRVNRPCLYDGDVSRFDIQN